MEKEQIVQRLKDLIVDIEGSRSNEINVSSSHEFQSAIDNAKDGDVINLRQQIYPGAFNIHGKHEKPVLIKGNDSVLINSTEYRSTLSNDKQAIGFVISDMEVRHAIANTDIIAFNHKTKEEQCKNIKLTNLDVMGDSHNGQKRGINLNGIDMTVSNCRVKEIKYDGQDSQAILIYNGEGPYTIIDNELEASGENFMSGGALPSIAGLVPSDVLFQGNKLVKPLYWMNEKWDIKNLFEIKNGKNFIIDFNIMENNWVINQPGYAILFTPRGQNSKAPWATVENITFSNNRVTNVSSGINITGDDDEGLSQRTNGIRLINNFVVTNKAQMKGEGRFLMVQRGPHQIEVENNTSINDGSSWIYTAKSEIKSERSKFIDNVGYHRQYGFMYEGSASGTKSLVDGYSNPTFVGNVLFGGSSKAYPAGNVFPTVEYATNSSYQLPLGKGCDLTKIPKEF
jgi:hypothetical protein